MDIEPAKAHFRQALNKLVSTSPLSLKAIKEAARRNGIGHSTLHAWRSGEHLPQVPEDNPNLRSFLHEIAANPADARETLALAKEAWRTSVQVKKRGRRTATIEAPADRHGGDGDADREPAAAEPEDREGFGAPAWARFGWRGRRGWGRCGWHRPNLDLARGTGVDSVKWPNCPTR